MAKVKKKRSKKYSGVDAAQQRPTVTRVQAVSRGRLNQWIFERQKLLKTTGTITLILAIILLIVSGIISLVS